MYINGKILTSSQTFLPTSWNTPGESHYLRPIVTLSPYVAISTDKDGTTPETARTIQGL